MQKLHGLFWFAATLAVLGLLVWNANKLVEQQTNTLPQTTTTTTTADTTPDTLFYPVPVPVWRDTGTTRWRYHEVDSAAIVADYLSRVAYRRVLKDDSSALAVIYDTVTANRLTSYRFDFVNRRPTTITHHTTTTGQCQNIGWMLHATAGLMADTGRARLMLGLQLTNNRQQSVALRADAALRVWQIDVALPLWRQRKVSRAE